MGEQYFCAKKSKVSPSIYQMVQFREQRLIDALFNQRHREFEPFFRKLAYNVNFLNMCTQKNIAENHSNEWESIVIERKILKHNTHIYTCQISKFLIIF